MSSSRRHGRGKTKESRGVPTQWSEWEWNAAGECWRRYRLDAYGKVVPENGSALGALLMRFKASTSSTITTNTMIRKSRMSQHNPRPSTPRVQSQSRRVPSKT
jgi:hypothetical protein